MARYFSSPVKAKLSLHEALNQCWINAGPTFVTLAHSLRCRCRQCVWLDEADETRDIKPTSGEYWTSVTDGQPTLTWHWFNISAVSSHSSHHPHKVILAQFSLYVHTGGLKSHSCHVHFLTIFRREIEIVDHTTHFVTDISRLSPTKACLGASVRFRAKRRHSVC